MPGNVHLHVGCEQASLGSFVLGENEIRGLQLRKRRLKSQQLLRVLQIGRLSAERIVDLSQS